MESKAYYLLSGKARHDIVFNNEVLSTQKVSLVFVYLLQSKTIMFSLDDVTTLVQFIDWLEARRGGGGFLYINF